MNMMCSRCKKRVAVVFMTRMENGQTVSGPLDVTYHRAISPILTHQLAGELIAYADTGKYFTEAVPFDTGYEAVKGFRYQGKYGLNTILLVCENTLVEANVLVGRGDGSQAEAVDLWIELMCRRLISE